MPNAREVLSHLNYLGYTNITAHQLKAFMIDLKQFMKYEEQNELLRQLEEKENQENIFENLHKTETIASKAKKKPKSPEKSKKTHKNLTRHVITVEINNPQEKSKIYVPKLILPASGDASDLSEDEIDGTSSRNCLNCCCNQKKNEKINEGNNCDEVDKIQNIPAPPNTIVGSNSTLKTTKSSKSGKTGKDLTNEGKNVREDRSGPSSSKSLPSLPLTATTNATSVSKGDKKSVRPKSSRSFIRPKIIHKTIKSDPVALYHQYKQEWDKIKFPGEHQHVETRWAVREKLLGDGY